MSECTAEPIGRAGRMTGRNLITTTTNPADLAHGGRWLVSSTFSGGFFAASFANFSPTPLQPDEYVAWPGLTGDWQSSVSAAEYEAQVESVRDSIAAGDVYQANICRILSHAAPSCDVAGLFAKLAEDSAPYAGFLRTPGRNVVCMSPELFLRRDHDQLTTRPIKGTALTPTGLGTKDRAENVMIVDLMRNDLAQVSEPGSVHVAKLNEVEQHPGLVHLVSTVTSRMQPGVSWAELLAKLQPAGSVSGAPKSSARRIIADLETHDRGPYCGLFGWVDADTQEAELAVAIRTFWWEAGQLNFGTGAGITWGSEAKREWAETELKAKHWLAAANLPAD